MIDIDALNLDDVMDIVDRVETSIHGYTVGEIRTIDLVDILDDISTLCLLVRKVNSMVIESQTFYIDHENKRLTK